MAGLPFTPFVHPLFRPLFTPDYTHGLSADSQISRPCTHQGSIFDFSYDRQVAFAEYPAYKGRDAKQLGKYFTHSLPNTIEAAVPFCTSVVLLLGCQSLTF